MKTLSPVVLFTYKRLTILNRVVDSLLSNKECSKTPLIVYSDGPKSNKDKEEIMAVRSYLKGLKGFKSVKYIFRDKNFGLAQSFIVGITETLKHHEKAIFIEDDNLLSEHFLSFMNEALEIYKDNKKVICVTGYSYPIKPSQKQPYFIRGAATWSMGTWRRGWKYFCDDGKKLLSKIKKQKLFEKFSSDGFDFDNMLISQIKGEIDSWGVRWWTSAYVNDMYCLVPNKPLCVSIGYGPDSVHCKSYSSIFRRPSDLSHEQVTFFPTIVNENPNVVRAIKKMNKLLKRHTVWYYIKYTLKYIKNIFTYNFNSKKH